jgi:dienelactone hydrolase
MRILLFTLALLAASASAIAQTEAPKAEELDNHYNYSSRMALGFSEGSVEQRGKSMLIELTYVGQSDEDHVPAYLVMPHGNGPYPAIVWVHWLKPGSRHANQDEFLDEALALAHSGVVSLLIEVPQARPTYVAEKEPYDALRQTSDMTQRTVVEVRRGVDLLMTRRNVDRNRIAVVGHSWGAHAGAIVAAVDKRVSSFVLMAGRFSDQESLFASKDPAAQAQVKEIGEEKLRDFFHDYAWSDPINFLPHTDGKSIFLQYGDQDSIPRDQAQKWFDAFSAKDKKIEFYPAGHALNNTALLDRARWLEQHLKFKHLDEQVLKEVPQLK